MCFFSPIRNDPKKTHKQLFGTHPVPGQSRNFVYVYVFFLFLISRANNKTSPGTPAGGSLFVPLGVPWTPGRCPEEFL